eukprot:SAG11_NODE_17037_length_530_cov_1.257541_1_plen_47_part_00
MLRDLHVLYPNRHLGVLLFTFFIRRDRRTRVTRLHVDRGSAIGTAA